jgi:hypothetical protein
MTFKKFNIFSLSFTAHDFKTLKQALLTSHMPHVFACQPYCYYLMDGIRKYRTAMASNGTMLS